MRAARGATHRIVAGAFLLFSYGATAAQDCRTSGESDVDCDGNGLRDSCEVLPRARFQMPDVLGTPSRPQSTTSGDLNGDGLPDLVSGGFEESVVSIFWNEGDRSFSPRLDTAMGPRVQEVSLADMNGDGRADIVAKLRDSITLVANDGDGAFAGPRMIASTGDRADWGQSDIDLDGDIDVILARIQDQELVFLINAGDATYSETAGPSSLAREFLLADVDGDGDEDMLGLIGQLLLLRSRGDGTFAGPEDLPLTGERASAVDVEGDSDLDLVFGLSDSIAISINNGTGRFGSPTHHDMPSRGGDLFPEDMDLDGDPDLLARVNDRSGVVLWNDGEGAFEPGRRFDLGFQGFMAADLDGDRSPDVISSDGWFPRVSLLWNDGSGGLEVPATYPFGDAWLLSAVDLDGDLSTDLLSSDSMRFNSGDGTFEHLRTLPSDGRTALPGDLDGDGDVDIVIAGLASSAILVYENLGARTFDVMDILQSGSDVSSIALGDVDADGHSDLVALPASVFLNNGQGAFRPPLSLDFDFQAFHGDVADFDGDSFGDLAVTARNSSQVSVIFLLRGRGDGAMDHWLQFPADDNPGLVKALDMDRDGRFDLVSVTSTSLSVHRNRGDGTFEPAGRIPLIIGALELSVAAQDFDLDGRLDLAVGSHGAHEVFFAMNRGVGLLEAGSLDIGQGVQSLAAGDLDGDGTPELAVYRSSTRDLMVIRNEVAVTAADCNGNGSPDACDIRDGSSQDRQENGMPDECEISPFHRGESNADGALDISDALHCLEYLFSDGPPPVCLDATDANADLMIDISDAVYTLGFLFLGSEPPPQPGPPGSPCGHGAGGPGASLGCGIYPACEDEERAP